MSDAETVFIDGVFSLIRIIIPAAICFLIWHRRDLGDASKEANGKKFSLSLEGVTMRQVVSKPSHCHSISEPPALTNGVGYAVVVYERGNHAIFPIRYEIRRRKLSLRYLRRHEPEIL
jgi:hypothetical protein